MLNGAGLVNVGLGQTHRLIWKTLQPENPSECIAGHCPLVVVEANSLGQRPRCDILTEHALGMESSFVLIAQQIERVAYQPLSYVSIIRPAGFGGKRRQVLGEAQCIAQAPGIYCGNPQSP